MPVRKYAVKLSRSERHALERLIQNEAPNNRRVKHARILLESDRGASATKIADWVRVSHTTVSARGDGMRKTDWKPH